MKRIIQLIFNFFGYKVMRYQSIRTHYNPEELIDYLSYNKQPLIFDVGANAGQSIEIYKKLFPESIIHSFEPNSYELNKLLIKYKDNNKIILNNYAVGEKEEENIEFNINVKSGNSSFYNVTKNTTWLKKRAETYGVEPDEYTAKKIIVKKITLDNYSEKKK